MVCFACLALFGLAWLRFALLCIAYLCSALPEFALLGLA